MSAFRTVVTNDRKHPAPVHGYSANIIDTRGPGSWYGVATVTGPANADMLDEWQANVRLLQMAPELLAALQFVAKFYQDNFDAMPVAFQTVDDIVTAAIEKATKE